MIPPDAGLPPRSNPLPVDHHTCGDRCVCPVHRTPMLYSSSARLHACQDPDCEHAGGVNLDRLNYEAILATETIRRVAPPEFWSVA